MTDTEEPEGEWLTLCLACKEETKRHCENPQCDWWKCNKCKTINLLAPE